MNNPFNYIRNYRKDLKVKKWGNEITGYVIRRGINNKTVIVKAFWKRFKPRYQTYAFKSKKYAVHDENHDCGLGDLVIIRSCLPLSKTKHFYVKRILRAGARNELWDNLTLEQTVISLINRNY